VGVWLSPLSALVIWPKSPIGRLGGRPVGHPSIHTKISIAHSIGWLNPEFLAPLFPLPHPLLPIPLSQLTHINFFRQYSLWDCGQNSTHIILNAKIVAILKITSPIETFTPIGWTRVNG
jgi:hypothetical protein